MKRAAAPLLLLLGGCASSSVLLLPDEEGAQGQIAVLETRGRPQDAVISAGNSRTRLGGVRPTTRQASQLRPAEQALLAGLPPRPASYTLYFLEGTTRLVESSRPQLAGLLADVSRRPGVEVEVTGHTDTLGSADDNDRLSDLRAREILGALAREGISRSSMVAVGRGERALRVPTPDNVRNAENRRVEVIVR